MESDRPPPEAGRASRDRPAPRWRWKGAVVCYLFGLLLPLALVVAWSWAVGSPGMVDIGVLLWLAMALVWTVLFPILWAIKALILLWIRRRSPRSILMTLGLGTLLVAVMHVLWFTLGWAPFHPLCEKSSTFRHVELMGPLRPEAADLFEDFFVEEWGEGAVRRSAPGVVELRPALRLFPIKFLLKRSRQAANIVLPPNGRRTENWRMECAAMANALMVEGEEARWGIGWGIWPYIEMDLDGPIVLWLIEQARDTSPRALP